MSELVTDRKQTRSEATVDADHTRHPSDPHHQTNLNQPARSTVIAAIEQRFVGRFVTVVTSQGHLLRGLADQVVSADNQLALWIRGSGAPVAFCDIRQLSVLAA